MIFGLTFTCKTTNNLSTDFKSQEVDLRITSVFNCDMGLTPKQQKLLQYINNYQTEKGYSPSQREIANHFGFKSLGTVQNYLKRLQDNQFLKKEWNSKRGIQVMNSSNPIPTMNHSEIPLLGKVAAGKPLQYELNESVEVPLSLLQKEADYFALLVNGDSMIDEGIFDGDLVVIKKQSSANHGDTVVAALNNEATIKKLYKQAGKIELLPANPKYQPIAVTPQNMFSIEGVLVGLIRRY
jgi:repressor LexA